MNRSRFGARTASAASAVLVALTAATAISGCGTGQIAQTTDQAPAVNGTEGDVGPIALRNVYIEAVQDGDFIRAGRTVNLVFVAVNDSAGTDDKLTGISTDIGSVSLAGDTDLPSGGTLIVGGAQARPTPDSSGGSRVTTAVVTVTLDKAISNGLTYDVIFDFDRAGRTGLRVPISAADLRG